MTRPYFSSQGTRQPWPTLSLFLGSLVSTVIQRPLMTIFMTYQHLGSLGKMVAFLVKKLDTGLVQPD